MSTELSLQEIFNRSFDSANNRLRTNSGASATLVVAASNAPALSKARADYVCDGVADDVEIQAALDALPTTGGCVVLSPGVFTIAAAITSTISNLAILGSGPGGYGIYPYGATHLQTNQAIVIFDLGSASATNHRGPKIENLSFFGNIS